MADSKKSKLDNLLGEVEKLGENLVGQTRVEHLLDTALVHALAGAKGEAEKLVEEALGVIKSYPGLQHPSVLRILKLAEAKVRALL